MTYSLALGNTIPAATAFSVTVNSAARTVSAVAVSGTTVSLTLASPVAYGDVVTVAYTKPSSNPLQTAAGAQAASFSAQNVTNNVAALAVPVYASSAVENATPTKINIVFSAEPCKYQFLLHQLSQLQLILPPEQSAQLPFQGRLFP